MSVASFAIIFSHSEGCLFTLLIVSFDVQKLLRLIRSHYLILSALPATQGIYGFVGFFMWLLVFKFDFAANGPLLFGMGLAMGLVCLFSAIRQGQVCANGIIGISQGHDVQTNTFIYAALPEFYAILGLAGVLMLALL